MTSSVETHAVKHIYTSLNLKKPTNFYIQSETEKEHEGTAWRKCCPQVGLTRLTNCRVISVVFKLKVKLE